MRVYTFRHRCGHEGEYIGFVFPFKCEGCGVTWKNAEDFRTDKEDKHEVKND